MRIAMFYHSLLSDWNHGNAHFLRGIVSELLARGHQVKVYEPENSWSLSNLLADAGQDALNGFRAAYPGLDSIRYDLDHLDLDHELDGVDLVIVHEWNERELARQLGLHRASGGSYRLLFHDTHHRSLTEPAKIAADYLKYYDGVLAYGRAIRDLYIQRGWTERAWIWHEAADTRIFHPFPHVQKGDDLVWIGNWGDGERSAELHEFLLEPVRNLGLSAKVYGVRYPACALATLEESGIEYGGWLPNYAVPAVFAQVRVTVHIPRRPYVQALRGIPTIRVFEALACGLPLVCAPWDDVEGLFTPGRDYVVARNGSEMERCLDTLLHDEAMAQELSDHGRSTILSRHTCAHRVNELLQIYRQLGSALPQWDSTLEPGVLVDSCVGGN